MAHTRRLFLKDAASGMAGVAARSMWGQAAADADPAGFPGARLPPWKAGVLELHHIDTGRGNATLMLGPDGTSLLIDAGEAHSPERMMSAARPNESQRAGEWIARYVARQLMRAGRSELDMALLTHLHGDHVGEVSPPSPQSARGPYRLTGFADVAEQVGVSEVFDRGWPDYCYPEPAADASAENYVRLARAMSARGSKVERVRAGSARQVGLRHDAAAYPRFEIRVLAVNGEVWTGEGEAATTHFPALAGLGKADLPTENMCSVAVRVRHGAFRYYSGGDLTGDTGYGRLPWHDIETPVARAAGAVSVAVVNHHGYFDASGPKTVRALRPRVWILPSWHASHPAMNVIANLFSPALYPGERSVFALGMTPEALVATERFSSRLSSKEGHVVVRAAEDGSEFTVFVVDARDEAGGVLASFGPYAS